MFTIAGSREIRNVIGRAELAINPEVIEPRLAAEKNLALSDFRALEGDAIEIDEPRWWDLAQIAAMPDAAKISNVDLESKKQELWLMEFGLSIAPAPEHVIKWARWMIKFESDGGGPEPAVLSLFPGRPSGNHNRMVLNASFRFVPFDAATPALVEIEAPPRDAASITGFVRGGNRPTWDLNDLVFGYIATYVVIRKPRNDRLRAEFSFHARSSVDGVEHSGSAESWKMGGKTYLL
jgi:hypothetical protein